MGLFRLGAAELGAVFRRLTVLLGARLVLADLPQVDDLAHRGLSFPGGQSSRSRRPAERSAAFAVLPAEVPDGRLPALLLVGAVSRVDFPQHDTLAAERIGDHIHRGDQHCFAPPHNIKNSAPSDDIS